MSNLVYYVLINIMNDSNVFEPEIQQNSQISPLFQTQKSTKYLECHKS